MSKRIFCTIITKSHLAFARTLSYSLSKYHPDSQLYVLFADRIDGFFDPLEEPFKTISLDSLSDQDLIKKMSFYYTPFEFCCALRGIFHEYIYEQNIADSWIFLDSDILVFNSLEEVFQQLEATSILLNPHIQAPINPPHVESLEVNILVSGVYNAGFLGLRRTEETQKFIEWFKQRLAQYGFSRRGKGVFSSLGSDQLWLNFVPQFFKEVSFITHPGVNVAYWNLNTHNITQRDQTYWIDNYPLLFVHFSGWEIDRPDVVSKHFPQQESHSYWSEWSEYYQSLLLKYGHETCKSYPYVFNTFADGQKITPAMRYLYYEALLDSAENTPDPFANADYFISKFSQRGIKLISRKILQKLLAFCN